MTNIIDLRESSREHSAPSDTNDVVAPEFHDEVAPAIESPASSIDANQLFAQLVASATSEPIAWEVSHEPSSKVQSRRYLLMAGFVAVGGIAAFTQSNWAVLLIAVLGSGIWELRERMHTTTRVSITDTMVTVDGIRYPHAQLTSFDIHTMNDGSHHLSFRVASAATPRLRVPLGGQDPERVHDLLSQYVIQEDHPLPIVEWLLHR